MNRVQKVTIRLDDIESKMLKENADRNQISVSEYMRNLIKQEKNNGGYYDTPMESIINNQAHNMWSKETENGSTT